MLVLGLLVASICGAGAQNTCGDYVDSDFALTATGSGYWYLGAGVSAVKDTAYITQDWQGVGQTVNGVADGDRLRMEGRIYGPDGVRVGVQLPSMDGFTLVARRVERM